MMNMKKDKAWRWGVTLLELLVVVVILSLLATLATGIYTGQTRKARIAATRSLIKDLEIAIARYEIDLGQLPPSGSGAPALPAAILSRSNGSGYLYTALVHSIDGSAYEPSSPLWNGPYINLQANHYDGTQSNLTERDILDPWGGAIYYVMNEDYNVSGGTFEGGTQFFASSLPSGGNPDLPAPNPVLDLGETFYNTSTYQIISFGPDGETLGSPYWGGALDDITNFN